MIEANFENSRVLLPQSENHHNFLESHATKMEPSILLPKAIPLLATYSFRESLSPLATTSGRGTLVALATTSCRETLVALATTSGEETLVALATTSGRGTLVALTTSKVSVILNAPASLPMLKVLLRLNRPPILN